MTTPQELREQIEILFNPIQAEYDNEAPMIPSDIGRIKRELLELITQALHRQDVESRISEWDLIGETLHSANIAAELHIYKVKEERIKELTDNLKEK